MTRTEQIAVANSTNRTRGAVGKNAVVPRVVRDLIPQGHIVLDFGSGREAQHAVALRADGWKLVDAWEFGANHNENHVSTLDHRERYYDCIYASNVLNVQSDAFMLKDTLETIGNLMHHAGSFICNYPQSPRKSDLSTGDVQGILEFLFNRVDRVKGTSGPVWVCKGYRGF